MRVHDENVIPAIPHNKTLHSRNKSSPALSTMAAAGAVKLPIKRTAFGDVSKTARANQAVRDTTVPASKPQHVQLEQDKKSTNTIQQPGQRPTSLGTGLKELNKSSALSSKPLAEVTASIASAVQRTLSKKNTTVFKDYSTIPKALNGQVTIQEGNAARDPLAVANKNVLPNVNISVSSKIEGPEKVRKTRSIQSIKGVKNGTIDQAPIIHQNNSTRSSANSLQRGSAEPHLQTLNASGKVAKQHSLSLRKEPIPTLVSVEQANKVSTRKESGLSEGVVANVAVPLASESEEYWDEDYEEDPENYEDDGYVTARSFRSKADNLTGNLTTTIVPRVSMKVRKELDAAAAIVTLSRPLMELEDEAWDVTMVSEYKEEIFDYFKELEVGCLIYLKEIEANDK